MVGFIFLNVYYIFRINTIKKWQARREEKIIVANRKSSMQAQFKSELGLLVDKPKIEFGSTNDGNTARHFFLEYGSSASITGIDSEIIKRFHIIMQIISSEHRINLEKF